MFIWDKVNQIADVVEANFYPSLCINYLPPFKEVYEHIITNSPFYNNSICMLFGGQNAISNVINFIHQTYVKSQTECKEW